MSLSNLMSAAHRPSGARNGWEEDELCDDSDQADIERRIQGRPSRSQHPTIGQTRDQDEEGVEAEREIEIILESQVAEVIEIIDLTTERAPRRPRTLANSPRRNLPVELPSLRLDNYTHNGMELRRDVTVELLEMPSSPRLCHASFLLIKLIISTPAGIILRGLPLTRTRNLRGQLPRLRNELALILEVDSDDLRPDDEQAAIEVPVDKVKGIRICHITNKVFPEHRFPLGIDDTIKDIEEKGVLVCRWKISYIWGDAVKRMNNKPPSEFVVVRIHEEDVPKRRFRASNSCLVNTWRGGKVRGGSFIPDEPESSRLMVNLEADEAQTSTLQDAEIPKKPGQKYTFGDMFCGAGGASCGAKRAGFRIELGVDNAPGACNTYRLHFPEADLRQQDMYDFIMEMIPSRLHIDVLHLSPPCQYWSPAHTTAGANDEANIAILFACHELVKRLRPRIFTVEQTFGILHPRFEFYFNALVHGFTQYDYSVRWKMINLLAWGASSQRQRLVMIGSCIGEELPPFPVATHSKEPVDGDGTRPYRTVKEVLRKIPPDAAWNDELHNTRKLKRVRKARWDPDVPLGRTITCSGGVGNYHYSGRRDFTLREYAVLQGFPANYQFQRPEQKKQIGNAFPPVVVKTLFKHLRRWLERKDRVSAREDELSESEEEYDIESELDYSDSDVEYLGGREVDRKTSDVEFLGGRTLRQQASVVTINDSELEDGMELDAMSQDVYSPKLSVERIQLTGCDRASPIELD
ncbi:S-adenosyl-L-methionine-dependent methyltransferase [Hypoxylon sp. FL0543]|nr:S-adenosyl-L-methionine-dependent methyltransferase [Hypoxylon sp. FL0543]